MAYLHPNVSSKIIDNSVTFVTGEGVTKLFVALTSDKGEDNTLKLVTSPDEYKFHYGEPDIAEHGQAPYNTMEWLQSGGSAIVLRVLPEDAGYSHAFVNIQTNEGTKEITNSDGDTVSVPEIDVKTTAAYTDVNHTSVSSLEEEMTRDHSETVDGYDNNYLFAVYPEGRGDAYDNLGFRISLNESYNATYDFTLYDFEVVQVRDNGSVNKLEGPFLVSLAPEAVSRSNESLFIEQVLDKYSEYLSVSFNEDAYDELGEIVNENINPSRLDYITFQTREINGDPDTFMYDVTGEEEDVNFFVGEVVDPDDSIEEAIVSMDNDYRGDQYEDLENTVDNMKEVYVASDYESELQEVYDSSGTDDAGSLVDANDELETANDGLDNLASDAPLEDFEGAAGDLILAVEGIIPELNKGRDYINVHTTTIAGETEIESAVDALWQETLKNARGSAYEGDLNEASTDFDNATGDSEVISEAQAAFSVAEEALEWAQANDITSDEDTPPEWVNLADTDISDAESALSDVESTLETIENKQRIGADIESDVSDLNSEVTTMLDSTQEAVEAVVVEQSCDKATSGYEDTSAAYTDVTAEIEANYTEDPDDETMIDSIEEAQDEVTLFEKELYELNLHDYNEFVKFDEGTLGSLEEEKDQLLSQAYQGLIDSSITNKNAYPIDMVIDANYSTQVKNAIATFCGDIRNDVMGILDTKFQPDPQRAIDYRDNDIPVDSFHLAVFTQDFIIEDEYTGKDIKVTSPYFLSGKIPTNDEEFGIQFPFVGPRRGTVSGFKKLSFNPNPQWKEKLYKKQINYVEQTTDQTRFGTQLTSQSVTSALSNINNVRVLLRMRRDVEEMADDYSFEFFNQAIPNFQSNLNNYLAQWVNNNACSSISGEVYASDYDRQNKLARVKVEMTFRNVIERVVIDLIVNQ